VPQARGTCRSGSRLPAGAVSKRLTGSPGHSDPPAFLFSRLPRCPGSHGLPEASPDLPAGSRPGTHPCIGVDQPTRLRLASAGSTAVKPGPSNEVRLPYDAITRRDLHQQPHDHELQLPYQKSSGN